MPRRYRDPFHTQALSTESVVTFDGHDLLVQETRDPLGNRVTAGERHTDPNRPPVRLRFGVFEVDLRAVFLHEGDWHGTGPDDREEKCGSESRDDRRHVGEGPRHERDDYLADELSGVLGAALAFAVFGGRFCLPSARQEFANEP